MILSEGEARELATKLLSYSRAESAVAEMTGWSRLNVRIACNTITTDGADEGFHCRVASSFGKRRGEATGNKAGLGDLAELVRLSEEVARVCPEDPEFLPPPGPQVYPPPKGYSPEAARLTAKDLAEHGRMILDLAEAKHVVAAAFLECESSFSAYAATSGLWVFQQSTRLQYAVSARTRDGGGAGWAAAAAYSPAEIDLPALGRRAVEKALLSRHPKPLAPGRYTVLLEPSAACDLIGILLLSLQARPADEGRSFLSRPGGGTLLGEQLFADSVSLRSDPEDPVAPGSIYSTDGLPATPTNWVEKGKLLELIRPRFWAQKKNAPVVPEPTNLLVCGGERSTDQLIPGVDRGVLVTRLWYIRTVDPRTLLLTGLTRDGTFWIEKGKIAYPVNNFRFNESPVRLLKNVLALGKSEVTVGSEIDDLPARVPAVLSKEFTFSSVSQAS
ncbi:Predicted Zn-dependent protease, modulator of DNA gyrase, PmbA protein [Methylacidimicrobium sp. AP8]|uniref:TldD/PmbA family protein n=1 Tax=Methylacidimicrobium sp. AP8 TaxID=2730359 RepID=UPI0018C16B4F|nr:TldD/PmbA family protein [Methylacidimicrobium sp. AP8]CAB4242673.1 Predicted Zn-dependent protease, modulator of DNA gyrase, PmbA protein [Methylacidimicrobium sp. AP8]